MGIAFQMGQILSHSVRYGMYKQGALKCGYNYRICPPPKIRLGFRLGLILTFNAYTNEL